MTSPGQTNRTQSISSGFNKYGVSNKLNNIRIEP
jgi:hypothetical protein